MPEGRLSRLLRAKLLRRSSTSAVTESEKAAGDGADPDIEADGNDSLSLLANSSPHSRRQGSRRPRPFSCVSSLPVDYPGDTNPAAISAVGAAKVDLDATTGPVRDSSAHQATGEEGQGARVDSHDTQTVRKARRKRSKQKDQIQTPRATTGSITVPDPTGSVPWTPTTDPAFTPSSTTSVSRPESEQSDAYSISKGREQTSNPGQSQLNPPLDSVSESQSRTQPIRTPSFPPTTPGNPKRPSIAVRRQSLLPPSQQHLVRNLLEPGLLSQHGDQFANPFATIPYEMVMRKIWVKRPGASPTMVSVSEEDLVDDLRDSVWRKYPNSLGRSFDSPDLLIRITPREGSNRQTYHERILNPEESLVSVLDSYYPGGQSVQEALIIDLPQRRTPRPSPGIYYHHSEPGEHGEYFPLMPVNVNVGTPPAHAPSAVSTGSGVSTHQAPSISVLTTGKVPPLPSPGNRPHRHPRRPPFPRHPTNSPTILAPVSVAKGICSVSILL